MFASVLVKSTGARFQVLPREGLKIIRHQGLKRWISVEMTQCNFENISSRNRMLPQQKLGNRSTSMLTDRSDPVSKFAFSQVFLFPCTFFLAVFEWSLSIQSIS